MLHEFRGLQRRDFRVDPRKAGRLVPTAAASAGDYYALSARGYQWSTSKVPLWHYLTPSLWPFRFVKAGSFGGEDGDAVAEAALTEEAVELPVGFPAALSAAGDFVPFVSWYALSHAVLWAVLVLLAGRFPPLIWGSCATAFQATVSFYARELGLCLMAVKVLAMAAGRVAALGGAPQCVLPLVANGAVVDVHLKLLLMLTEAFGCLAGALLLAGLGVPFLLPCVIPILVARHALRGLTRPALLQHFAARPACAAGARESAFAPSLADIELKLARAESDCTVKAVLVALALLLCSPPAGAVVAVAVAALAAHAGVVIGRVAGALVCTELNPQRAELCMTAFYGAERKAAAADRSHAAARKKDEDSGLAGADGMLAAGLTATVDVSPRVVSRWERLLVLPACGCGPFHPDGEGRAEEGVLHRVWARFPSLKVNLSAGVGLSHVLRNRVGVSSRHKMEVIQAVEGSLTVRGVALLFDEPSAKYYAVFPAPFTRDGHPAAWTPLRESAAASSADFDADGIARRREIPSEGPKWPSLSRRLLWAYFYAYSHQQAAGFTGTTTATPPPLPPPPNPKHNGVPLAATAVTEARARTDSGIVQQSSAPLQPPIHVIDALRADGVLDLRRRRASKPIHADAETGEADGEEPRETVSREHGEDPAGGVDGLYPVYERFVALLERQGWDLDRFSMCQEGVTVSIMFM